MGLSCNFSLKPIQWQTRALSLQPDIYVEFLADIKQWWILRLSYAEKHPDAFIMFGQAET